MGKPGCLPPRSSLGERRIDARLGALWRIRSGSVSRLSSMSAVVCGPCAEGRLPQRRAFL
eukprot:3325618-Heterocapsa_arctica.AAC.1